MTAGSASASRDSPWAFSTDLIAGRPQVWDINPDGAFQLFRIGHAVGGGKGRQHGIGLA